MPIFKTDFYKFSFCTISIKLINLFLYDFLFNDSIENLKRNFNISFSNSCNLFIYFNRFLTNQDGFT